MTSTDLATALTSTRFGRIAATLPVSDMARALAFYEHGLGFERVFQNGDPVGFVILKRDDAEVHLTLQPGHKPPAFAVAHMMVGDVDALHALVRSFGLRILKGLRTHDYGLRAFVFADPDGNRIDVAGPVQDSSANGT
jgi:catechol 2,3-dioxygenase-like lactoylglutathione lyase family enzyme